MDNNHPFDKHTHPNPIHPSIHPLTHLHRKLYVAAAKRSVLQCVDLSPEFRSLLTTDHLETNMHAVRDAWMDRWMAC